MNCPNITCCCVEFVLLSEASANRDALVRDYFSDEERGPAAALPNRSLAGRIAVKRAVCTLLQDTGALMPRDVVIEKAQSGAPKVLSLHTTSKSSFSIRPADIFISVSHSKTAAMGAAAIGASPPRISPSSPRGEQ